MASKKPSQELSHREMNFVCEYLVDGCATRAAIRAGYAERGAHVTGSRLLRRPKVVKELARRRDRSRERLEITADRVMLELARIAFADATHIATVERGRVTVLDTAKMGKDVTATIREIKENREGLTVRQHDKLRALELLSRHLGLLDPETGKNDPPIDGFDDGDEMDA
jgi:phage terminase small subunit